LSTRATAGFSVFIRLSVVHLVLRIIADRLIAIELVEGCRSWFNRFRRPLVRYEKLERGFIALNHLAAAIIAFRKVPLNVNISYG